MEGMDHDRKSSVCVERSFSGFRLERQVLAAAYELVMPVLGPLVATQHDRAGWIAQRRVRAETTVRPSGSTVPMAKGA